MTATNRSRRAFTLVELLAAMAVMSIIMGGIASALVLATRAMPDGRTPGDAVVQGYRAADAVAGDIYGALAFSLKTPTAVEFTIPDRDADGLSETIRYEWSGTPGDPLTRKYNTQTPATFMENVHEFQLDYLLRSVSDTITTQVPQTSSVELAFFESWGGVAGVATDSRLDAANWVSQYFTISVPQGATKLDFTQARLMLRRDISGIPTNVIVAVHRAKADGSYEPEAAPVGPAATIAGSAILSTYAWADANFSGLSVTDLTQTAYCLVIKGSDGVPVPGWLQTRYLKVAQDNGTVHRWTVDGGVSWNPTPLQLNQRDSMFHIYGTFTLPPQQQQTTITRDYLTSVDLLVRVGSDTSAQVRTSSQVINAPEVTGQ